MGTFVKVLCQVVSCATSGVISVTPFTASELFSYNFATLIKQFQQIMPILA